MLDRPALLAVSLVLLGVPAAVAEAPRPPATLTPAEAGVRAEALLRELRDGRTGSAATEPAATGSTRPAPVKARATAPTPERPAAPRIRSICIGCG